MMAEEVLDNRFGCLGALVKDGHPHVYVLRALSRIE